MAQALHPMRIQEALIVEGNYSGSYVSGAFAELRPWYLPCSFDNISPEVQRWLPLNPKDTMYVCMFISYLT